MRITSTRGLMLVLKSFSYCWSLLKHFTVIIPANNTSFPRLQFTINCDFSLPIIFSIWIATRPSLDQISAEWLIDILSAVINLFFYYFLSRAYILDLCRSVSHSSKEAVKDTLRAIASQEVRGKKENDKNYVN